MELVFLFEHHKGLECSLVIFLIPHFKNFKAFYSLWFAHEYFDRTHNFVQFALPGMSKWFTCIYSTNRNVKSTGFPKHVGAIWEATLVD